MVFCVDRLPFDSTLEVQTGDPPVSFALGKRKTQVLPSLNFISGLYPPPPPGLNQNLFMYVATTLPSPFGLIRSTGSSLSVIILSDSHQCHRDSRGDKFNVRHLELNASHQVRFFGTNGLQSQLVSIAFDFPPTSLNYSPVVSM